ncbi:MAG: DUF456 family protein [Caldilineaceae bacterium]
MFASELNLLGVAGSALVVLGFIGTVLPIVPGPIIIWLGAFVWAWGDGFQRIGWPTLAVLGLLAVLAWGMDFFLTAVVSRRAGSELAGHRWGHRRRAAGRHVARHPPRSWGRSSAHC